MEKKKNEKNIKSNDVALVLNFKKRNTKLYWGNNFYGNHKNLGAK